MDIYSGVSMKLCISGIAYRINSSRLVHALIHVPANVRQVALDLRCSSRQAGIGPLKREALR